MKLERNPLRSRLGRRLFLLFGLCALLPVSANAWISYRTASSKLYAQGQDQLAAWTKNLGVGAFERLRLAEIELEMQRDPARVYFNPEGALADMEQQFLEIEIWPLERFLAAWEQLPASWITTDEVIDRLELALSALMIDYGSGNELKFYMVRPYDPQDLESGGVLVGRIDPSYLWAGMMLEDPGGTAPAAFVLDPTGRLIYSHPSPTVERLPEQFRAGVAPGSYEWTVSGETHAAAVFPLPVRYQFGAPFLNFVALTPRSALLAAASGYRETFIPVAMATIWLVLLLSVGQIRRSLVPMQHLVAGTERIAAGDFKTQVEIVSKDEFANLGQAFNDMAGRIDSQFTLLQTIGDVDRHVLGTLDLKSIAGTVLEFLLDTAGAPAATLVVLPQRGETDVTSFSRNSDDPDKLAIDRYPSPFEAPEALACVSAAGKLDWSMQWPDYLVPLRRCGSQQAVVLTIRADNEAVALLAVALFGDRELRIDRSALDQMTDQVAVALSKATLVHDLAEIKEGALLALARSVDAKSKWTAGHSERVTDMSVRIGRAMGLGDDDLERLYRGGLLHDIGKIGVPNAVLDKPGKMTDEEFEMMKAHPVIGARILEPIRSYEDVIPIVLQHHEKWDGTGYPDRARGEQIHPLARICAVADVWDACRSTRPYRAGMEVEEVVAIILKGEGTHFAPEAVRGFEQMMKTDREFRAA